MAFLIVGVVLLLLYFADVSPVANWHWGWIALPFGLAAAWWAFVDATGLTQKREVRKMEERKVARRQRDMEALGLTTSREKKRVRVMRDAPRTPNPPPPAAAKKPPSPTDPSRRDPRP